MRISNSYKAIGLLLQEKIILKGENIFSPFA